MNLLHTFTFPRHNLYVYDTVDQMRMPPGHVCASISNLDSTHFCPDVGCSSTPCHFNNTHESCTIAVQSFIREQLSLTHPEYFI